MNTKFTITYEYNGVQNKTEWYASTKESALALFKSWHSDVKVISVDKFAKGGE